MARIEDDELDPFDPASEEEFDAEARAGEEVRGFFPDLLRRTLTMGFTGLFLTEEAVRKALGPSVPREWVQYVMTQSENTRKELVDRLGREFGRMMSALDPVEVLKRLFDGQTLEVSAKIRFATEDRPRDAQMRGRWSREPGKTSEPEPE